MMGSVKNAAVCVTAFFFGGSPVSAIDIQFHDRAFRRIQDIAREDIAVIAENEEILNAHVAEWYTLVDKVSQSLGVEPATSTAEQAKKNTVSAVSVDKKDVVKENTTKNAAARAELDNLEQQMAEQHAKTDSVRAALNSVMGPAMMIPVLQEMYEKFKGDIKRATQQEKKAKDRVTQQETQFVQWKKEGKTYLLADKQRVIDYYKRQRDIQHKHYHAMLKMAHSMMERIKMVKGMCGKATKGEALSEKEKQELTMMAPNSGK